MELCKIEDVGVLERIHCTSLTLNALWNAAVLRLSIPAKLRAPFAIESVAIKSTSRS
jgi:hypothetical protein